ncbi:MAG TPA: CHASE domain-containing protein [Polyangiales bacterium]|nr:CHASE domain-containing protein [Polyangiales bacterium]
MDVRAKRISSAWVPLAVTLFGLVLTGWGVQLELDHVRETDRQRFAVLTERLKFEIHQRVQVYRAGLLGFRGLYVASTSVRRNEFRGAVAIHDLPAEFPGAHGVGYIRAVPRAHVQEFLAETRADGAPDFQLRTKGDHDPLMVIELVEPLAHNRAAEGFDIAQEPLRREAAERAMLTGEASLTAKVTLVQALKSGPGFLYFAPIYRNGAPASTVAERRAAIAGWVFMPISAARVFRGAADITQGELDFEVFEGSEASLGGLLYDNNSHVSLARAAMAPAFSDRVLLRLSTLRIGGQLWTTVMSTTRLFHAQSRSTAWAIAVGGSAFAFLLGLLVRAQSSAVRRAQALADSMTSDLEEAQAVGRLGNWRLELATSQMQWSKQLYVLFGRDGASPAPDFAGWSAMFTEADAARHGELVARAADSGASYSAVLQTRGIENDVRFVRVEGRARSREDKVVALYGTAMDVSAEVAREESLRIAQRRAEDASRSKSEFLANMSHEIRTPMTAILGYADMLAENGAAAASRQQRIDYCDTIRRNGEHLLAIINDILDISKIEAGMLKVECVPTEVEPIVREIVSLMHAKARAKGLSLEYVRWADIPATIRTDPMRLRQILINLIGNAVKFSEVGGVVVTASLEPSDPPRLRFEVADTGIGLTEEQGATLFGAFQQADSSTTRKFGGTGLGLRISKRLAQMLGGDITFTSELRKGSVFSATIEALPLTAAQAPAALVSRERAASRRPLPSSQRPLEGVRILLAEDGKDNQRLISHHLRKAGAEVRIVDNGRLAVEALSADGTVAGALMASLPVDLILTDMQMPEMDGYLTTQVLREKGCTLPIVALTAHTMSGDAERCLAVGCDAYAAKPIDRLELIDLCRRASSGELRERPRNLERKAAGP